MKIYVAASLTHATEEFKVRIEDFKKILRSKYEVLDFLGLINGTAYDVYRHDTDCVKLCDLLIADVSYPAFGVGFEVSLALALGKNVLAVAENKAKLSRMILGNDNPKYKLVRYKKIDEILNLIQNYE